MLKDKGLKIQFMLAVTCVAMVASMGALLVSCGGGNTEAAMEEAANESAATEESAAEPAEDITYQHLSGEEVVALMESDDNAVLVDVREPLAYQYEHIVGAINVPQSKMAEQAESAFPDKDQTIILYCDYGGVSKIAAEDLVDMGYTNVIEFDGLEDWPGETEKDESIK
jgi:rhodanese-related sulfurtransferase